MVAGKFLYPGFIDLVHYNEERNDKDESKINPVFAGNGIPDLSGRKYGQRHRRDFRDFF
jgi:hypothetical protein